MNYYCVLAMFISIFIATILVAPSTMANYAEAGEFQIFEYFFFNFKSYATSVRYYKLVTRLGGGKKKQIFLSSFRNTFGKV